MKPAFFFLLTFALSAAATLLIRQGAVRLGVVDLPDGQRKLHGRAVPLLGGVAVWFSFWLVVGYLLRYTNLISPPLDTRHLWGVFIGSAIIMAVGIVDDVRPLPAWVRMLGGAAAVLAVLGSGVGLSKITNPLGGTIPLDEWGIGLPGLGSMLVIGDILIFCWLMGMMYTTKIMDGLDGLCAGIVLVGTLVIWFLTRTQEFYQPEVGQLALVFLGALGGFLVFNFYPATIFLGEAGSLFVGFMLGVLAIIAGGKFATALLVMAVPIMDLARVIVVRIRHRQPVFKGDREHIYFRLRAVGWSEPAVVFFLYAVAFSFGLTTLFLQSLAKLIVLALIGLAMVVFMAWLNRQPAR